MFQTERSFDYVKINLASPKRIRGWAERVLPNGEKSVKLQNQKQSIIVHLNQKWVVFL